MSLDACDDDDEEGQDSHDVPSSHKRKGRDTGDSPKHKRVRPESTLQDRYARMLRPDVPLSEADRHDYMRLQVRNARLMDEGDRLQARLKEQRATIQRLQNEILELKAPSATDVSAGEGNPQGCADTVPDDQQMSVGDSAVEAHSGPPPAVLCTSAVEADPAPPPAVSESIPPAGPSTAGENVEDIVMRESADADALPSGSGSA